jgi:hypothetical protein
MLIGDIQFERAELLRRGDCRAISSGPEFIHSLFHLDRPSVSLVVRTTNDPETYPQYGYLKPFIAKDAVRKPPRLVQRQRIVRYLTEQAHPALSSVLQPVLAERRRELDLVMRRQTVRAADLRFFLALLLNLPERKSIEEMVCTHQPERAPVDVIYLLEEPSMDAAIERLRDTYDTGGIDDDLRRLCDAVTSSPLLRPLFVH